ncbi:hypothetical protein [Alcaligenes faecalis]|uniref:hypothetical protein n=1 Tax=Alcaligenes faecalis TaxID=511 RepID=UPI00129414BF|nr:hypothetical protein [Alcaligenes faecalis]
MYKQTSGAMGMMALLFALFTVIAATVAIYTYGKIAIVEPGLYGLSSSVKTVTNWPLIISCVSAGFYSIAFAALFMYVETTRNAVAKIANHLGIKEEEPGNAQSTSQAADEQEQPSVSVTPSKGNIRRGQRSV